jgi:hypothetical protein
MNKSETITISLNSETLDKIRNQATKEYRSINKHIQYIIDQYMKGNK